MKIVDGDILEVTEGVIIHQVNTKGVTGGLARALRRKWPDQFNTYIEACRESNGYELLGDAIRGLGIPMIVHIFGQVRPGPNTDMAAVEAAFELVSSDHIESSLQWYAPFKMGCGLGGGCWEKYSAALDRYFPKLIVLRKEGYD